MTTLWTIIGIVIALVAAVAAVGSWVAAQQSRRAADTMAKIEQQRRHNELRPQITVTCTASGGDQAMLHVSLDGPDDLERLDEVIVSIRDDQPRTGSPMAGGPSKEEVAEVIWGPYRLVPQVDGVDRTGRATAPVVLEVADARPFALERSIQPKWYEDHAGWRRRYQGSPVRVQVTCRREGHEPWIIRRDIEVQPASS